MKKYINYFCRLFILLYLIILVSCTKLIKTNEEFNELTHSSGLGHFYYIGSGEEFHYFAADSFLSSTDYYKYPKEKYIIKSTFSKTANKVEWVPYIFDGKRKTEGFEKLD